MRTLLVFLLTVLALLPGSAVSTAQEPARLALLIGNKGYTTKVGPLKNPHTDVDLVEASLKRLGFKVTVLKDATYKQMDTALKRYVAEVRRAGKGALSFFYYSGHGVANPENGLNYLIPVDVADADDDKVWFESFQQNVIIDTLSKQAPGATHYLVFDACRNELNVTGVNAKALGADKGFVPVADTAGLLIAYATAPKRTASDAGAGGGPYAKALAEELVKPGVESVTMFRNVQIKVKESIGQDPWLSFPSLPRVYLAGQPDAVTSGSGSAAETVRVCREVGTVTSLAMLAVLEKQHTGTPAADCISARIGELKAAQSAALAKPAPIPAPAPEPARPAVVTGPKPGETFRDCPTCPEMVVVPAGSFKMGSPDSEAERSADEGPVRTVTIGAPFAVGKYEVTVGQFKAFVATGNKIEGGCTIWSGSEWKQQADKSWRDPGFAQTDAHPVTCVNWNDAKAYVAWLSKATGQGYRLLTEAEWEYAARAGTTTTFSTGATITTKQANFNGNFTYGSSTKGEYRQKTVEVGSLKSPNTFGLHDMHGNVWEWVEDCWIDSYKGAPSDASARTTACTDDSRRVLRGGSWIDLPEDLRSAGRDRNASDIRGDFSGFRVARSVSR
jgi:formylglycine-generating enzyme required for sulfatase activity